jgi:LmbE family N-acetylglucosaminyl deacetylase
MSLIKQILEKLSYKRLKTRADQIADLYFNSNVTVYPKAMRLSDERGKKILVLTPHADDETFGAGGAIRLHIENGDEVHVVLISDNLASVKDVKGREQEIIAMRESEFSSAMSILGVKHYNMLRIPDKEFQPTDAKNDQLMALFVENQPDVLYLPSLFDNHQDHRTLNIWVEKALKTIPHEKILCRGYEVWSPLPATAVLDISSVVGIKQDAIRCYSSQLHYIQYDHHISGLNAYRAMTLADKSTYAEAFLEVAARDYISMIERYFES